MKGTAYMDLLPSEEAYLEIEYDHTPGQRSHDPYQPDDPSETEVVRVLLHEITTSKERVTIDVTSWYETIVDYDRVLELIQESVDA